jgi:hypothetical protein
MEILSRAGQANFDTSYCAVTLAPGSDLCLDVIYTSILLFLNVGFQVSRARVLVQRNQSDARKLPPPLPRIQEEKYGEREILRGTQSQDMVWVLQKESH